LEETADLQPNETQILVKIKAAGVNPVDTYVRAGNHATAPNLPFTPGKDGAGIVESVGGKVSKVKTGDRVYLANSVSGTYAEYALCEENQVHKLPENITFEQGACLSVPYATSFWALFDKGKPEKGETVLIHGASGGVGIAAIQHAKHFGLKIIGTASSEEGKTLIKEQGADYVFDHSAPSYLDEIMSATDGKGVDIILEMLANVNLQNDLNIIGVKGRIVVIGNRGEITINPRSIMGRDATIRGFSLHTLTDAETDSIHAALYEGLAGGWLNPIVGKTFPLEEAAKAHHVVIEEKAFGKIVLLTD
jgi:NADPH2:quinone reductase